mmetsp:Transcript_101135/g.182542  ORF Transcript_101135/g.182542 Transcript_101135/m.182542 type:complete len:212 (+) Transcript_101135:126-761(+)
MRTHTYCWFGLMGCEISSTIELRRHIKVKARRSSSTEPMATKPATSRAQTASALPGSVMTPTSIRIATTRMVTPRSTSATKWSIALVTLRFSFSLAAVLPSEPLAVPPCPVQPGCTRLWSTAERCCTLDSFSPFAGEVQQLEPGSQDSSAHATGEKSLRRFRLAFCAGGSPRLRLGLSTCMPICGGGGRSVAVSLSGKEKAGGGGKTSSPP